MGVVAQVGWELLVKDGTVFKCYDNPWDTRYYGDSGASLLVLKAGHNLDTLLTRYQGVDWWSQNTWGCNERCAWGGCGWVGQGMGMGALSRRGHGTAPRVS